MSCGTLYDGRVPDSQPERNSVLRSATICRLTAQQIDVQTIDAQQIALTSPSLASMNTLQTNKIVEQVPGAGVYIDHPMIANPMGISKAWMTEFIKIYDEAITLEPEDWTLAFETTGGGPSMLLQNGHLFQVPLASQYANDCVEDACLLIRVTVSILELHDIEFEDVSLPTLVLLKNGEPWTQSPFMVLADGEDTATFTTMHLDDIVKCAPGDTLDVGLSSRHKSTFIPSYVGSSFWAPSDDTIVNGVSFATFQVLGFGTTDCSTVLPPESF